jgi:hypothetical protein
MIIGPSMGAIIDATGKVFRYTFAMGGVLAGIALISAWIVFRQFVRLGGPDGYVAPE